MESGGSPTTSPNHAQTQIPWWKRFSRWKQTSTKEALDAESGLLRAAGCPDLLRTYDVLVGPGKQNYLHTLEGGKTEGAPPVVLMPGYGAGSGFYWRNFCGLASSLKFYAVDWLGTGLSGRPSFTATSRADTEAFFLDSMVKWRHQLGMTGKMILVGHSLGGYLSACYALKYPEHVQHLILVCPAGVPKEPEDWQHKFLGVSGWRGQAFKASMWAWESGLTPQAVIRTLGPWGAQLCDGYVSRRFATSLPADQADWFKRYFYQQLAAKGSGEYALRHLLAPGAWAHEPLSQRLKELKVPVTFIYGREDWMRPQHAVELCDELRKERSPKVSTDLHVSIIDNAGHFVFIDQPEQFNRALIDACSMYMDKSTEQQASQAHPHAHATVHTATSTLYEHRVREQDSSEDEAKESLHRG